MGAKKVDLNVDELLSKLQLNEAEKDEVVLAKVDRENLPAVKWMAAARLLSSKDFSTTSLISTMRSAWNPAREVTFRAIGKNLFVIQAFCLGDWKRIMEEGPWIFRGYALMLEEFDGSTTIPKVIPYRVLGWIQIHKIPHLFRIEAIVKQLAAKVGEVQEIEMRAIASRTGDFHRVRVKLLATKPLVRVVTLAPEGQAKMLLQVKYEKLPRFCAHCGLMGHVHMECGAGEYAEKDLQFGAWMVAEAETWHPGTPRFRTFDREVPREDAARGGGRGDRPAWDGRGQTGGRGARPPMWKAKMAPASDSSGSRKRPSAEVGEETPEDQDLADTASSPIKMTSVAGGGEDGSSARKQLVLEDEPKVPPPPPSYTSPRDIKRARRAEEKKGNLNNNDGAGSLGEHRQSP